MSLAPIVTIWRKELRDTIRDRKTLASMVLMPLILVPVLLIGISKFTAWQANQAANSTVKIAVLNQESAPSLAMIINSQEKIETVNLAGQDPKTAVADQQVDAAVIIPDHLAQQMTDQQPAVLEVWRKSTNDKSPTALARVMAGVAQYNNKIKADRFKAQKINPAILTEVTVKPEDVISEKEMGGFVLGFILPMFIVMWSIIGGQYTAIDVSAGEKERKTLEALLLTPVKRIDIVWGKFWAVATVAAISVVLAIGSMYLALKYGGLSTSLNNANNMANLSNAAQNLEKNKALAFNLEPQAIVIMLVVSLLLVAMFSAVILSISIFANNYKEASSYIGPSYLVVILPVVLLNALPGLKIPLWLFGVPAANGVLLFKETLLGTYNTAHIALTIVSLIIFSILAILIAAKIYSQENILFKE